MSRVKFDTLTSLHKARYGAWAGNPRGQAPDPDLCCEEILPPGRGMIFSQCSKRRGNGPEQAYCSTHDPDRVKARQAAAQQKYDAYWSSERRRSALQSCAPRLIDVLRAIADGHNDPRSLAAETLGQLDPLVLP